jgi:hypothetical protein
MPGKLADISGQLAAFDDKLAKDISETHFVLHTHDRRVSGAKLFIDCARSCRANNGAVDLAEAGDTSQFPLGDGSPFAAPGGRIFTPPPNIALAK